MNQFFPKRDEGFFKPFKQTSFKNYRKKTLRKGFFTCLYFELELQEIQVFSFFSIFYKK